MKRLLATLTAAVCAIALLTAGAPQPPQPFLNIGCTKLASATSPTRYFDTAVLTRDAAHESITGFRMLPDDYSIRQVGGLTCEWSNGVGRHGPYGDWLGWTGIRLELLPDGIADFRRFAKATGLTGTETLYCVSTPRLACYYEGMIDGDWLSLETQGVRTAAEGRALLREFREAVRLAGPSGVPTWAPPIGTIPLPATCDELVGIDRVESAFGSTRPLEAYPGEEISSSPGSGAIQRIGAPDCTWIAAGTYIGVGQLASLPGGAWAWAEARSRFVAPSRLSVLRIPGMAPGDQAYQRCDAAHTMCYVDLIIGGNWLSLQAFPEEGAGIVTADRRAALVAIADEIVAGLRG